MHVKFLGIFSLEPADPWVGYPEMADKAEILELACYSFDNLSKLLVIQINDKCIISSVKIGQVLVTRSRKFDQMRLDYRQ